jgi:serine/threonine protein kinase
MPDMAEFEFVVSDGPRKGQVHAFPGDHFFVGSDDASQLRFDPELMRPRHAEVALDETGHPWVRDLAGGGQVFVNGEVVDQAPLPEGCFLRIGRVELVLRPRGVASGPRGTVATPRRTGNVGAVRASAVGQQRAARTSGVERPWHDTAIRTSGASTDPQGSAVEAGAEAPVEATAISHILTPGTVIDGRYHVVDKLAAGGMGEVYRVEHVELGKAMAVKVMLPELSRDPEFVARFKREAIAASRIGQQNIVDISDFGQTADGRFYFVMEFLDGVTLANLIEREGALAPERAVRVSLQIAQALAAAHALSIVHRDLKPENIILVQRPGQPDFVKVLDFGVAKVSRGQGKGGQTQVGTVVGTPQYMSPEQAKGINVDARSDVYSLGLIIYELITGRPTFTAETPSMLMVKHVTEAPPPFHMGGASDGPPELEALVMQMLQKDPAARPDSMDGVVQALEDLWAVLKTTQSGIRRISGSNLPAANPARASGVAIRVTGGQRSVTSSSVGAVPAVSDDLTVVPRRSPAPLVVGGLALLAVLGGVVAYAVKGAPAAEPAPTTVVVAPPVNERPAPPAQDPPPVEKVALTFRSVPEKAEVYEGDVLLGSTPFTLERPKDSPPMELTFSAKGYTSVTRKVGFVAAQDVAVELEKDVKLAPVKKRPTGAPTPDEGLKDNPF